MATSRRSGTINRMYLHVEHRGSLRWEKDCEILRYFQHLNEKGANCLGGFNLIITLCFIIIIVVSYNLVNIFLSKIQAGECSPRPTKPTKQNYSNFIESALIQVVICRVNLLGVQQRMVVFRVWCHFDAPHFWASQLIVGCWQESNVYTKQNKTN